MRTTVSALARLWRDYRATVLFLLLMLCFRSSWADWVVVPTGSMNPTIIEGDRVLVNKHALGWRLPFSHLRLTPGATPRRGDIVVFDSPADGRLLVKRIAAVPGDTLALDGEVLIIDGERAVYAPESVDRLRDLLRATAALSPQVLRETSMGKPHEVMLLPGGAPASTFGPVVVPPGDYFMLGDNRDNSADSRYFGFVPRGNIVGRAIEVVVSLNPERYDLPRPDRVLLPLN